MANDLAPMQPEFFAQYSEAAGGGPSDDIEGRLLRFAKGDYVIGSGDEALPPNSRVLVDMGKLTAGWVRWDGKRPVERRTGYVGSGFQPAPREALGHEDTSQWPVGLDGKRQDPWAFTNQFVCRVGSKDVYTFVTSSKGGIKAVGKLCGAYASGMRTRAKGEMPIVELGSDSYRHADFGVIKYPELAIVDWGSKKDAEEPRKKIASRKAA